MAERRPKKTQEVRSKEMLFIVSAPSGAGKTALCQELTKIIPGLKHSVSYATRPPRKGEINNVHYSFISRAKFKRMIDKGEFAEWAMVHGNLYGTSIKRLENMNNEGYDIIFDVDIHGAIQMKRKYKDAVYIFILPPSMKTLKKRLRNRMSESNDEITKRLENAKYEIANYKNYDYIVINDKFEEALQDVESIIKAARLRTVRADQVWIKRLLESDSTDLTR